MAIMYPEVWFIEEHTKNARYSLKIKKQLYSGKSKFQQIDVYETFEFGKLLTLDGYIMTTERDEFVYHEMITHVPSFSHPNPKKALIIGGGDGGTLRELVKHPTFDEIIMCEIDEKVVEISKKYLPTLSTALNGKDERVKLVFDDGVKFIKNYKGYFDVIIVDSTDPIGPGEVLFSVDFYKLVFDALKEEGIMTNQTENPWYDAHLLKGIAQRMREVFPMVKFYNAFIPSYPSGMWTFGFASKIIDPEKPMGISRFNDSFNTNYYTPDVHTAAFKLPVFQKKLVEG